MALERSTIVQAALQLLDKVGLEGLSTRKLAQDLGVQGPSLYWHFKSKRELLDHMAEAMLIEHLPTPGPMESQQSWDDWLATGAYCIRAAALSRRDGAQVLAAARPTGASPVLSHPAMIARLKEAGFSEAAAFNIILAIGSFTIGWVQIEQAGIGHGKGGAQIAGFEFGLRALLSGLRERLAAGGEVAPAEALEAAAPLRRPAARPLS
jgi:TetR/AcrR family transcriptional regulator, tetracycline repressor protein